MVPVLKELTSLGESDRQADEGMRRGPRGEAQVLGSWGRWGGFLEEMTKEQSLRRRAVGPVGAESWGVGECTKAGGEPGA